MRRPEETGAPRALRCAIYTRKSTEEGLDQEFNSLDAQREACAAYILSQRHEGWSLLPDFYDDGGFSGGSMDRPGLQRLLADVKAGKVDVIVVYKVDRLTRALSDFARIVETLDDAGASFVSVTQAFNTTTSMGRLTLNVLLSFAQFEREVISERVRDKVAASKRKGMWMGGTVPLGYDVVDRKLVINEMEADTVLHIMRRYVELGSVRPLIAELAREGIRTKVQRLRDGATRGGIPFSRGALYCLLKNPVYIGRIPHKENSFPNQHESIVPRELWHQVQQLLAKNAADRRFGTNAEEPSLLAGMICDGSGRTMTPCHAKKGSRRYRYYVSVQEDGAPAEAGQRPLRIPAGEIEKLVTAGLAKLLSCTSIIETELELFHLDPLQCADEVRRLQALGATVGDLAPPELRRVFENLDLRIVADREEVTATYASAGLCQGSAGEGADRCSNANKRRELPLPGNLLRFGQEVRVVLAGPSTGVQQRRDRRLVALLVKGFAARRELVEVPPGPENAARRSHLARLARVSYLAPDIVQAIMDGKHPASLTSRKLLRIGEMPVDWSQQRSALGFTAYM